MKLFDVYISRELILEHRFITCINAFRVKLTTKNRNEICIEITMNNLQCDMNDNLLIRLIARPRIFFDDQIGTDIELLTRCRKFNRAIHIIIDFLPSIIYVSIKRVLSLLTKNLRLDTNLRDEMTHILRFIP